MYRLLLCFRYLRTRYIALASIISVTLGVATLIVVNSVMAGFSAEMHERLHGLASDIVIECHASGGMPDPDAHLDEINRIVGDQIAGSSVSVHVPSMLGIDFNGQLITHHVNLVGIDAETYDNVSHFGRYLLHPENKNAVSFDLREDGYEESREGFPHSGWTYRRDHARMQKAWDAERKRIAELSREAARLASGKPQKDSTEMVESDGPSISFGGPTIGTALPEGLREDGAGDSPVYFDAETEQYPGIILGIATCSNKSRDAEGNVRDHYYCRPGDDVRLMFPNASDKPKVVNQKFTVVDLYESGMSEYDSTFAFVRLDQLQDFRGMIDPISNTTSITTIQLKLIEGADLNAVRDALRQRFPPDTYAYSIQTWRDMQGPLLAAVRLETTILNILLFLIIAVAGFGILATFFMIVVEKTRDIGTLKALGASGSGVMSIFLSYGLLLGIVGSGVGLIGGIAFVHNINDIASVIEKITGQEVFDPTVYYFTEIPTILNPFTLAWVMAGAIAIATTASVLPAIRAARMHPVAALRFE
ncbi:LolC/E family lipoprotein releasing system, transmembrane protein [Rhodopirellula baltica SH28]|uniref:LolC/E family lipoprotein releasing system, transmembrane protein n=2 Tax=Rhodopirellula baltica TaxID=265606 RepID=K5CF34_RHOBT|nr:ABC transporter permease [Rhodopirellula baltica]EKK02500.1 LolC/E family lipoprotein releasing system, transmembrane protein [Rhodopirellula baltica SH28]ELP35106.1 LolC/E family lipoprotein releasing system, transmembrane protein [Rhodopirellula baltica SWK14]